ncbi:hypothetical protein K1719_014768 [Acacia pycnantha]|nr:hypothetical protein K1719_014768 [Acacia pycnantha]
MERKLKMLWARKGEIDVFDLENEFYLVNFQQHEDYMEALTGGPWVVADAYLNVARWRPDFDPKKATIDSVVAWVRFPDLPAPLFDKKFLLNVGNSIGKGERSGREDLPGSVRGGRKMQRDKEGDMEVEEKEERVVAENAKEDEGGRWKTVHRVRRMRNVGRMYGGLGMRKTELMNDALLSKVIWNLLANPGNLCSRVLVGKYGRQQDLFKECKAMKADSELWRNLARLWPNVVNNISWEVGNGEHVKFWHDKWVGGNKRLSEMSIGDLTEDENKLRVADMIGTDGNWFLTGLRRE